MSVRLGVGRLIFMSSCVMVNKLGGCLSGGLLDGVEVVWKKFGLWSWVGPSLNPRISCLAVLCFRQTFSCFFSKRPPMPRVFECMNTRSGPPQSVANSFLAFAPGSSGSSWNPFSSRALASRNLLIRLAGRQSYSRK